MSSKACTPISSSNEKMRTESEITIECTLDGYIKDYQKKGTPLRTSSIIGKLFYDLLKESCRYEVCLKHIYAIAHKGDIHRLESVTIQRILCSETKNFSCILLANEDSLMIYLGRCGGEEFGGSNT